MSRYLVWLADGRSNDDDGCAPQVLLTLTDPVWGANTWRISEPNSWIGTGGSQYRVAKIPHTAFTCQIQAGSRFVLVADRYPGCFSEDAENSSGVGWYVSPSAPGQSRPLRWFSYGTIRPEPC